MVVFIYIEIKPKIRYVTSRASTVVELQLSFQQAHIKIPVLGTLYPLLPQIIICYLMSFKIVVNIISVF